jgi:hypothetical protein
MVLGDDFVASAVVAQRFTKWNVNVNGQRPVFLTHALLAKFQGLVQIGLRKGLYKPIRRRV